jgi:cobalt-zinc-cadmium efflux system membrane fusion protein
MKTNIHYLIILLMLAGCHSQKEQAKVVNYQNDGEDIVIPNNSNIKAKLKTAPVVQESYRLQVFSPAKVSAIPTKYAEIAAPFNGRIGKVFIKLGQPVEPQTPLFTIYSSEYTDAQKLYMQALRQFQLAEKDLKRQTDLMENGVGVQKELEAVRTNYDVIKSELEKTKASIRIFGVDPETMDFGEPLVVRSPIQGTVIQNKIVVGKYLTNSSESILTVAELSSVWITATVKEKDIRFVHEDDGVEAEVLAYPGEVFKGSVYHIEEMVDENTRAINVLSEFKNQGRKLKPGMYASVKIIDKAIQAQFVPARALLQQNDKSFVFVEVGPGRYRRRDVITGETVDGKILITEGLKIGESLVSEGGFYLLTAK